VIISGYITIYQINKFYVNNYFFIDNKTVSGTGFGPGYSLETPVIDYENQW